MDLQDFYLRCSEKVLDEKYFPFNKGFMFSKIIESDELFTYQDHINAFSEHDAIHYLLEYPFTGEGEYRVEWVEYHFQVGWGPYDNTMKCEFTRHEIVSKLPEGFSRLKILETAEQLRKLY